MAPARATKVFALLITLYAMFLVPAMMEELGGLRGAATILRSLAGAS